MTEQDYQALIAMSVVVWRVIGVLREPVLSRIKIRLVAGFGNEKGVMLHSYIVWLFAFVIGYLAAVGAGDDGDILAKLGWWNGHYIQFGWALTAGLIASGSAGLRLAEKWISVKIPVQPNA